MEALILIPLGLIIYGWMQSLPNQPVLPACINGTNGFCDDYVANSKSLFANQDDDDTFSIITGTDNDICSGAGISLNGDIFSSGCGIDPLDMIHEMMFNPAYEWCDFNIYHHDNHFIDDSMNSMNDTFTSAFDGGFSTGIGEL